MEERYTRLFSLPENLYSAGAPVMIAAGALLKDNQTGKVLAQLKLRSLVDQRVKAVKVKIAPLDMVGKPLGETVDHLYLDLNASRDVEFGQKVPIPLPDATTRGFQASVLEVVFADNTLWAAGDAPWEPLSAPVPLAQALADDELAKQYRIQYGEDSVNLFHPERDLWRCACGALNHQNEPVCHKCHKQAAALAALDLGKLKADRDKRLEMDRQKAAEEKAAAKRKARIAIPTAAVAVLSCLLLFHFMQKRQVEAANAEAYQAALDSIQGQYIDETSYPDFEQAYNTFVELRDYKNSTKIAQQLRTEIHIYETLEEQTRYSLVIDSSNIEAIMYYINHDFQYINPKEFLGDFLVTNIRFIFPYIGEWEYLSGDPNILSFENEDEQRSLSISSNVSTVFQFFDKNEAVMFTPLQVDGTSDIFNWMYSSQQNIQPFFNQATQYSMKYPKSISDVFYYDSIYMTITPDDTLQISYASSDGSTTVSCEYQRIAEQKD